MGRDDPSPLDTEARGSTPEETVRVARHFEEVFEKESLLEAERIERCTRCRYTELCFRLTILSILKDQKNKRRGWFWPVNLKELI